MRPIAGSALILAVLVAAGGSQAAFPGKPGKLVFQSNRGGDYELYVANANGSGARKLLSRPQTDEFNANWSPSGRKLVFQTGPPDRSTYDIWTVNADGKAAKPLVAGQTNDRAPQFCDEKTVVFTRQLTAANSEVFAIGTNGKGLRQLTNHPASDSFPTCNPKGTRIAFISSRDGPPRIYEMTRTGGGLRAIADGVDPDYSSDGKAIAYVAPDGDRNLEVFTKSLATGAVAQRTNVKPPFEYRLPKFVPEGATRQASARADEKDEIVATQRDTSAQPVEEQLIEIRPDGSEDLVTEPASGGAPQPVPAEKCTCSDLDVLVEKARLDMTGGTPAVEISLQWTLACTRGTGGCEGRFRVLAPRKFEPGGKRETLAVKCLGKCAKSTTVRVAFQYVFASDDPKAANGGIVFRIAFACERKRYERTYKLIFQPGGKLLDREKSDLNGNRIADGKER